MKWLQSLRLDLTLAIKAETAKERLWREIQEARPSALEQVRALEDLEHWPLPETLRWLDYFGALDDSVAPKEKLIGLLLEHKEELAAPEDESAEATFLTEVQRHVAMVRQAAVTIIAQLGEQLQEAEVEERRRHPWFANGKALVDFKPKELSGAEEMKIPFVELNAGDEAPWTMNLADAKPAKHCQSRISLSLGGGGSHGAPQRLGLDRLEVELTWLGAG